MAFTAYIMDDNGERRLETVNSEEVAPKGNDPDPDLDLDLDELDFMYWQNPID